MKDFRNFITHAMKKTEAEKRPENVLSFNLRLILA